MNAAEIIKKDLDAIYIGNLSTVDDNLTLPENGKYGAQFTWETGEERFIDNTGRLPQHMKDVVSQENMWRPYCRKQKKIS